MSQGLNVLEKRGPYQHGLVGITLVNEKDGVTRDYSLQENFITPVGKQLDNVMGPGRLLSVGANVFGLKHAHQNMTLYGRETENPIASIRGDWRTEMTLVLLSLEDDINNITEETSTIYINDDAGTQYAYKVVGYANGNISPVANGKEGVIDYTKGEYAANKMIIANRWVFDTDVAVGTIDAVAVMPASIVKKEGGVGISIWTCLDKVNAQDANLVSFSTRFCPPGITGFTGNDEILVNYNVGGKQKHKVTLTNYDVEDLEDTEPWFLFPENTVDWIKIDNYIYVLAGVITGTLKVYVYDATTLVEITNFNITYRGSTTSQTNRCKAAFLYVGGVLYVTQNQIGTVAANSDRVHVLDKGSQQYFSKWKNTETKTNYDGIAVIPDFITDKNKVCIGHFGNKYIMYVVQWYGEIAEQSTGLGRYNRCYVFTDLSDIAGSIVKGEEYFGIDSYSVRYNTATRDGFIRIGTAYTSSSSSGSSNGRRLTGMYDLTSGSKVVVNNTTGNDSYKTVYMHDNGVWISDKSEHGNAYSIRKLTTPVTKGKDDKLYVSYGYQRT